MFVIKRKAGFRDQRKFNNSVDMNLGLARIGSLLWREIITLEWVPVNRES